MVIGEFLVGKPAIRATLAMYSLLGFQLKKYLNLYLESSLEWPLQSENRFLFKSRKSTDNNTYTFQAWISTHSLFWIYSRPMLLRATKPERTHLKSLIRKIETESPFDALGFFTIELSTLTAILSTMLTYLIIMIQFAPDQPMFGGNNPSKDQPGVTTGQEK